MVKLALCSKFACGCLHIELQKYKNKRKEDLRTKKNTTKVEKEKNEYIAYRTVRLARPFRKRLLSRNWNWNMWGLHK
jgi:predicted type IV restriction endonuclease